MWNSTRGPLQVPLICQVVGGNKSLHEPIHPTHLVWRETVDENFHLVTTIPQSTFSFLAFQLQSFYALNLNVRPRATKLLFSFLSCHLCIGKLALHFEMCGSLSPIILLLAFGFQTKLRPHYLIYLSCYSRNLRNLERLTKYTEMC